MTTVTPNYEFIGIRLSPPALYPPPRLTGSMMAHITTVVPVPDDTEFDYLLNGVLGGGDGISVYIHDRIKVLRVDQHFLESYTGPFPALVEVRCVRDGVPLDLARLPLLDTHNAQAHGMNAKAYPDVGEIPLDAGMTRVQIQVDFVDADNIPLPPPWDTWTTRLDVTLPGVELDGEWLLIRPEARPGPVTVYVTASSGFEEVVHLTLVPWNKDRASDR